MKPAPTVLALLASALAAPIAVAGAPENNVPVVAFRSAPAAPDARQFGRGTPESVVLLTLGEPDARLGRSVWIYWNYRLNRADPATRELDTLVLSLADERVTGLKMVSRRNVEPYLALAAQRREAARAFAAK